MGVIGGSVSSGHGVGCQPSWFCENNMHRRIFDHLDALFPARNGSSVGVDAKHEGKNSLVNGAQPATGESLAPLGRLVEQVQEAGTSRSASASTYPRM